jgi:sugar/nucleoside kinase (ribokinase family)
MSDILCAGILVADTFCGPMAALPHEGQLLAVESMPVHAGGCAANVAIGLAKQGFSADVVGCMGRDSSAKVLLDCLGRFGVGCGHISYTDRYPTSTTVILLVQGQDRRYIHSFGANKAFTIEQIEPAWLDGLKVFYLGGLFAMPGIRTDRCLDLLAACRRKGIATVLDVVLPHDFAGPACDEGVSPACVADVPSASSPFPVVSPPAPQQKQRQDADKMSATHSAAATESPGQAALRALLPHVDYFLPNDDEAKLITGLDDPAAQVRSLLAMGAGTVVVTHGKAGAVAGRGGRLWRSGIFKMDGIDPSGSGDAFAGGIVTGIVRGYDLPAMLQCASALGASATRAIGTTDGVFTAGELDAFLKDNPMAVRELADGQGAGKESEPKGEPS